MQMLFYDAFELGAERVWAQWDVRRMGR